MKNLFIIFSFIFVVSCAPPKEYLGVMCVYDDSNKMIYTSSRIEHVEIYGKKSLVALIFPESDANDLRRVTSENRGKTLSVYMDDLFLSKIVLYRPIQANEIEVPFVDENQLIHQMYRNGISFIEMN